MINPELKKKIINTLGQYEKKMDEMQLEIDLLKDSIHQLVIAPMSLRMELKDPVVQLSASLNSEIEPVSLGQKVSELSQLIMSLSEKERDNHQATIALLTQGSDLFKKAPLFPQDLKLIERFQSSIIKEDEFRRALIHFNEVISHCLDSIISKSSTSKNGDQSLDPKVNESLYQLVNHLAIPKELDGRKDTIKASLEASINPQNLCQIINSVTDLLVDAFNMEQNRFKSFLQRLNGQLLDFEAYLQESLSDQASAASERNELEAGIEKDLHQIKDHIDNSKTIEELSGKISSNFDSIGKRLKAFQAKERQREEHYREAVNDLQIKLSESEKESEEIRKLLTFQRYRMNHDSLTGLPNRDSYDDHITEAYQRWKRSGKSLSLAIADIDYFKRINDNFGHLAGDKVLKKVAAIFRSAVRTVDFISRIGGEEFVFIFELTQPDDAMLIIEKLRQLVEDTQFIYKDDKVDVTVSFGLTSIQNDDTIESLFARADKALYKAKNSGRNRVESLK